MPPGLIQVDRRVEARMRLGQDMGDIANDEISEACHGRTVATIGRGFVTVMTIFLRSQEGKC